jgi:hypothetical protein
MSLAGDYDRLLDKRDALEAEVKRLRAANRQLEHTLGRIAIGDTRDPRECAQFGLKEARRRLDA